MDTQEDDYQRMTNVLAYLEKNVTSQPSLKDIAQSVGLTEHYFQKLFSRWVGISPKRFLQALTKEHAKKLLQDSQSVLDTSIAVGLSSPSRLHDLFVKCDAMTPGDYAYNGKNLTLYFGFHPCPFGRCFIAITDRGICHLSFIDTNENSEHIAQLNREWPQATLIHSDKKTENIVKAIFNRTNNWKADNHQALYVLLKGTNFQIKVWEALLSIPSGKLVNYKRVAETIGQPTASRAVGSAIGKNNIGFLIPCHRVIQQSGQIGQYRWGSTRKKLIIASESSSIYVGNGIEQQ